MTANSGLRLRPTMLSDLDFVVGVEEDAANRPYITPWERTQHEGAVRFPDFRHFVVEAGTGTEPVGFVILQGCRRCRCSRPSTAPASRPGWRPWPDAQGDPFVPGGDRPALDDGGRAAVAPDTRRLPPVACGELDGTLTTAALTKLMGKGKGEAQARRELMELRGDAVEVDV